MNDTLQFWLTVLIICVIAAGLVSAVIAIIMGVFVSRDIRDTRKRMRENRRRHNLNGRL